MPPFFSRRREVLGARGQAHLRSTTTTTTTNTTTATTTNTTTATTTTTNNNNTMNNYNNRTAPPETPQQGSPHARCLCHRVFVFFKEL